MKILKRFIVGVLALASAFSPFSSASASAQTLSSCFQSLGRPLGTVSSRAPLAKSFGISNYIGSASQNTTFASRLCASTPAVTSETLGAVPSNGGLPGIYNATTTDLVLRDGYGSSLAVDRNARLLLSPSSTISISSISAGTTSTALGTTTGANTIPLAIYTSATLALTEGAADPLIVDALGNLRTTMATKIFGEDTVNDVMKVEQQMSVYATSSGVGTTTVKSGAGYFDSITIWGGTTGTLAIFDSLSGSGTNIVPSTTICPGSGNAYSCVLPRTIPIHGKFATGLTYTIGGAMTMTFSYR